MRIDDYVKTARSTAIYEARFTYPALGLPDEIGETVDKLIPNTTTQNLARGDLVEVAKELGDVLWYTVNVCLDIGYTFYDIIDRLTGGLRADTFTEAAFQRLRGDDRRSPFLKLCVYSGRIAGVAKKALRDSGGTVPPAKREVVLASLVEVLSSLFELCERYNINPDDMAQWNADKLTSRLERGKITGDGDNR